MRRADPMFGEFKLWAMRTAIALSIRAMCPAWGPWRAGSYAQNTYALASRRCAMSI